MHMAPAEIVHIYISDITQPCQPIRRPRLGNSQSQIESRLLSLVSWRALLETMQEPVANAPPQQDAIKTGCSQVGTWLRTEETCRAGLVANRKPQTSRAPRAILYFSKSDHGVSLACRRHEVESACQ